MPESGIARRGGMIDRAPPKAIRIGLLWHSANSPNLGVGALTISNLALARRAAITLGLEPHFTILGMDDAHEGYVPASEAEVFGINFKRLISPAGCWKVFGEQDCVLDIGGGDSFADIHGPRRFFFLWATKVLALARGTPLLLSPQTIGPFTRTPYKQLARGVMEAASAVVGAEDRPVLEALIPPGRAAERGTDPVGRRRPDDAALHAQPQKGG